MLLMTVFGAAAVLLAAIGIYGLMAYSVEQRTQEIGIRLALGAETGRVRRMIVLQGMSLAAIGVVVGIASALGPHALHGEPVVRRPGTRSDGLRGHSPVVDRRRSRGRLAAGEPRHARRPTYGAQMRVIG